MRLGRLAALGLLVLMAGGRDVGSHPRAIEPVGATPDGLGFTFRVRTPPVVSTGTPEGGTRIEIEGFGGVERRPGAPDLPTHTVLLAIPAGAVPRIELTRVVETVRPGWRPAPVPRRRATTRLGDDAVLPGSVSALDVKLERVAERLEYREDAALYGPASGTGPIARLGAIGVLRNQRYVEVHLAPARFDPAIEGLRIAESFEVTVRFDGWDGALSPAAPDRFFEPIYRERFLNAAQGTDFRLDASGAFESSAGASTSAGGGVDNPNARRRIRVRADGIVRLDHGLVAGTDFISEPLSTWKLTNRGVEVPLQIVDDDGDAIPEPTDGNDLLDPGERVQFWGQALDDEPKTELNTDLTGPDDIWTYLDASDENIYFLTVETGTRARVATLESAPTHTRTPPTEFDAVAHVEVDDAWRPLADGDPWFWLPTLFGPDSRQHDVPLPGLASPTSPVRVKVLLQGRSEDAIVFPDHATRVTLKNDSNQTLAMQNDDGTFDGRTLFLHDFNWSFGGGAQLSDPARVQIEALSPPNGAARNDAIPDSIEIDYRRSFQAVGDTLGFTWPDGDAEFVVDNLQGPAPEVFELTGRLPGTDIVDAVRLTALEVSGAGPYSVRFRVDNDPGLADGTPREFIVVGDAATSVPAAPDFEIDTVSTLRSDTTQADMIVIAHPDVLDDPANCASTTLTALLNYRLGQDGITSRVACVQDVYDEFDDGIAGPTAIRNFLAWVLSGSGWAAPKPTYVLFLGDASYDYKAGTANGSYVPTQILFLDSPIIGYYASDNDLAAVVGPDPLPDLVPGRIPVRTVAEADLVLQKILDYEQNPPAGDWVKHAVFVADRGKRAANGAVNVGESVQFEDTNSVAESYMKVPPHTSLELRYWSDYCDTLAAPPQPCDPDMMRAAIKDALNGLDAFSGASVIQFTGHGSPEVWSDDAFFDERDPAFLRDTNDLNNGGRLPWMLAHNCLTGGFHTTLDHSMGEDWLLRDDGSGGGGSVAVFAPTGLSFSFIGGAVVDEMWSSMFGPAKARDVATPMMDALGYLCSQLGLTDACQNYAYLGDPALKLVFPAVEPAATVLACGNDKQVDLSWSPSSSPNVTYDVYRTESLFQAYTLAGSTAATTFSDMGLVNSRTYYYYVVARDAAGFESAWSNFNTGCASGDDCVGDGDDCVFATPLNPNPPMPPTGLVVTDPEAGGRLELNWTANSESDIAYYEVHRSTQPGCFDDVGCTPITENAGRSPSHLLVGLQDGVEYFVVVTATNTSGKRSAASTEESGTPHFVRGVKSPSFISDLHVDKSGADALLSWSAVNEDIYGLGETVARYEVYRGQTPQFVPAPADKIGETTATSFTDPGALGGGLPDYYYLVRAVDIDGNGGGLGNQLPAGISDLTLGWAQSGTCSISTGQVCTQNDQCPMGETCDTQPDRNRLVLSWSAVTTEFSSTGTGAPTVIDHYEVYASDTPLARSDICDPLGTACTGLTPVQTVGGTSAEINPPAAQDRYYSVLAVDRKGNQSPF